MARPTYLVVSAPGSLATKNCDPRPIPEPVPVPVPVQVFSPQNPPLDCVHVVNRSRNASARVQVPTKWSDMLQADLGPEENSDGGVSRSRNHRRKTVYVTTKDVEVRAK
ncbi:hypothetical protein GE21DRAFT_1274606 [Neurospora crassa]|nr:hypothetical protein GE21DRAFT_1274606 [Neurospora crassa]